MRLYKRRDFGFYGLFLSLFERGGDCSEFDPNVTPQNRISVLAGLKQMAMSVGGKGSGPEIIPNHLGNGVDMTMKTIGLPVLSILKANPNNTIISPSGIIYNIPDGVLYGEILGGIEWPTPETQMFQDFNDYVSHLFQWSNEFVMPMLPGLSLQEIESVYFANTSFMIQTQAYYGAYILSLSK